MPLGDPKNRRIENRIPGAALSCDCGNLAAVWLGLQEKRHQRPRKISGEDLETLPRNLDVALDAERAKPLHKVLAKICHAVCRGKRAEAEAFLEVISPWEREYLLLNV